MSEGWTIVIMDRPSRFLWTMSCGERNETLFMEAIHDICQVIAQTDDLTLLTDGERRYGNFLFTTCCQALYTGKPGQPKKTLPEGVSVRLMACFRRKINTYAKDSENLQSRLDVHWLLHNFVRKHFTTKLVPAVSLGVMMTCLTLAQLFRIQTFPFN